MNTTPDFWQAFFDATPDACLSYEKADDGVSVYRYDQRAAMRVGPRLALFATMLAAAQVIAKARAASTTKNFQLSLF